MFDSFFLIEIHVSKAIMHALIQLLFCNIGDIEKLLKMTLVVICSCSYNTFPPYRDYRSLY